MIEIRKKYRYISTMSCILLVILIAGTVFKGNIYKLVGDDHNKLGKDEMASVYYERAIKNDYGSNVAIKTSLKKMKNIIEKEYITFMKGVSIGRLAKVGGS